MPEAPAAEVNSIADAETSADQTLSEVDMLRSKVAEAEAKAAAARDAHMRAVAEFDNLRKRSERDVQAARQYGAETLLGELLGVADSLDLGLAAAAKPEAQMSALTEGMQLTLRQLLATLEKHGVKQVDPVGEPFNPDFHEAVTMLPSADVAPNHVLNVMQKGYRLHDRLLRPALGVGARAPGEPAP
ncbi:MAG: nucleotide exchange factor GrpE [Panacagrimonas sp.]